MSWIGLHYIAICYDQSMIKYLLFIYSANEFISHQSKKEVERVLSILRENEA